MKFRFLVLALALLPTVAPAFDADGIRALAKEPHDRDGIKEELKIYPDAREYTMEVVYQALGEEPHKSEAVTVSEKIVKGKYLVSEFTLPIHETPSIMVVTFDEKAKVYRKWLLMPDGSMAELIGTSVAGSRAITWRGVKAPESEEFQEGPTLALENSTDTQTTWIEIYMKDGKESHRLSGVATAIK